MKFLKPAIIFAAMAAIAATADAKPAKRATFTVTQPDGTTLEIRKTGDEFMHFTTTADGYLLHRDDNGLFTFGRLDENGAVVSTGVSASSPGKAVNKIHLDNVNFDNIARLRNVSGMRKWNENTAPMHARARVPQSGYGRVSSTYPNLGSPKGLVILVEYSDVPFTTKNAKEFFDDLINGENFTQYGGTGSALKYFTDQSQGKFIPSFDVYGPVTLPHERAYYGGNDRYNDDLNPHLMVSDAIEILDPTVDFSPYDTDNDGLIDNVYIFYAGVGEADSNEANSVWPHSWDVRQGGVNLTVDGVTVAQYACSNEWDYLTNRPDGIGTFVHEFSHVMGLPDLYHTVNMNATYTPGEYDVLDAGCYNNESRTPPAYSAYARNAMGWLEPIVINEAMTLTLDPISTGQAALIPTSQNTEFFLLENRQLEGWDKYLPGHGMLIWHIQYNKLAFAYNQVNNTQTHQYVDIEEANRNPNNTSRTLMAGWPFPGTTGATEFTSTTNPALKSWAGVAINYPITNIEEDGGTITFYAAGGKGRLESPVPSATVDNEGDRHFIASWAPVENATDYFITVMSASEGDSGEVTNGFDGTTLGEGWTASKEDWFTSSIFFGKNTPSYRFSEEGQWLLTPVFTGDISEISFFSKGQNMQNSETYLIIEGLSNGEWINITNYYPKNLVADNVKLEVPSDVRQIRFTFVREKGYISIDDIVITYGGREDVLPDYNSVSTGGATSFKVDKLKEGHSSYCFTVAAYDGKQRSKKSEPVYVKVVGMTGVDNIVVDGNDTDSPAVYYNLQGVRTNNPAPGQLMIRRQGNTTTKVIVK